MQKQEISLDWINENYGEFLLKYSIKETDIIDQYLDWYKINKSEPISKYLFHLLSQIGLFIAKSANTEKEGHELRMELSKKLLEYSKMFQKAESGYWERQIQFDKKQLEKLEKK